MAGRAARGARLLGVAGALLASADARAQRGEAAVAAELSGYAESRHHLVLGLDPGLADLPLPFDELGVHPDRRYGALERLRPTLRLTLGESAALVFTPEASTSHGFLDKRQDRVEDVVTVERLHVTATMGGLDHTAGKQLVAWGSGLLLNPTDPFNQRQPGDLRAERPGVWAMRTLWAPDEAGNAILVAAMEPGARCCDAVLIGRAERTIGLTDAALQVVWDERTDERVLGADVKTELEVGLWAEAALRLAADRPARVDLEAGIDYSFEFGPTAFYLAAEYLRQGDGLTGAGSAAYLAARFGEGPLARRAFLGRDHAAGILRIDLDPRWQVQAVTVTNLRDRSSLGVPQLTWLPGEAWELTAGARLAFGPPDGEYTARVPANPLVPADLHGARVVPPADLFVWVRHAF